MQANHLRHYYCCISTVIAAISINSLLISAKVPTAGVNKTLSFKAYKACFLLVSDCSLLFIFIIQKDFLHPKNQRC